MSRSRFSVFVAAFLVLAVGIMTTIVIQRHNLIPPNRVENEPERYEMLIAGLANRNDAPPLVEVSTGQLPMFPENFDWSEQERVMKVWGRIMQTDDSLLFESFINHLHDASYALTANCLAHRNASNLSVGDLCRKAVWARFNFAIVHLTKEGGDRSDRIRLDLGMTDIGSWRSTRSGKCLWELQLEACQLASEAIEADQHISREARDRIQSNLRERITALNKSRSPLFFPVDWDACILFDPSKAERARKEIALGRDERPE
ncbi:MAG: hypothetical protein JSS02_35340 [Planctomycetes bacterium]|nr:hypothetical protein [Planctomycetota bacterium]